MFTAILQEFTEQNDYAAIKATSPSTPVIDSNIIETSLALLIQNAVDDSPTLKEALNSPDSDKWKAGIHKELDTLWSTGTWVTVPRSSIPAQSKPITAKVHLKLKQDPVRMTTQNKARFVCRGFNQIAGVDFNETYSPVANFKSIKTLLTICANRNYEIHQLDYDAAFLNADIKEEVYVEPIPGLDDRVQPGYVYKLLKTLYGLKQSPREWWMLIRQELLKLNWKQTLTDQCIFFREKPAGTEYLAIYVDDLIVFAPNDEAMSTAKNELTSIFKSKDLGEISYVLGIRVSRDRKVRSVTMDQAHLIEKYQTQYEISGTALTPGF